MLPLKNLYSSSFRVSSPIRTFNRWSQLKISSSFDQTNNFSKNFKTWGAVATASLLAASSFHSTQCYAASPKIQTERLCVLYDAGESNALIPLLLKWEKEGKDFRVLVTATAETIVKPESFLGKRLTLKDLGIEENIDNQTPRTQLLSEVSIKRLEDIQPELVLVGTASKIQEQFLKQFSNAATVAFVDNFYYDTNNETFQTVKKVQANARDVFCPSQEVINILNENEEHRSLTHKPTYHVVGKPSLEVWEKEISQVNSNEVMTKLGLSKSKGPIVTFIGGYGYGYDLVNPIIDEFAEKLKQAGYQIIIQPHPKIAHQIVKTTEALAVSDYVVGYNSSVVLDASICGKKTVFFIPKERPYQHFAITKGYLAKVENYEELLAYLKQKNETQDVRQILNVPVNSTQLISEKIDKLVSANKKTSNPSNR